MWEGKSKVVYLHGRPSAHPLHQLFAKAVASKFYFIDEPIRWQDKSYPSIFILIIWILNAVLFKHKTQETIYLVDNLHISPIIYKKIFKPKSLQQKFIAHLGSHTLYFIKNKKFNLFNTILHKWALKNYDALICEGQMAADMARAILKEKTPPIYTTFLGPLRSRIIELNDVMPSFESKRILILASGPTKFRMYYKGLDIMIKSLNIFLENKLDYFVDIVGIWDEDVIKHCLTLVNNQLKDKIIFHGFKNDVKSYIKNAALCLHVSRGDAFPTSTIEVMSAGVPVIVSDETGTKELAERIDSNLVVKINEDNIVNGLTWFFSLPCEKRQILSKRCKEISAYYCEENAVDFYVNTFHKILSEL